MNGQSQTLPAREDEWRCHLNGMHNSVGYLTHMKKETGRPKRYNHQKDEWWQLDKPCQDGSGDYICLDRLEGAIRRQDRERGREQYVRWMDIHQLVETIGCPVVGWG